MSRILDLIHLQKVYTEEKIADMLDSDLADETRAYTAFIQILSQKIVIVKAFQTAWEHGSLEDITRKFSEVKRINDRLITTLNDLVVEIGRDREVTKSFFYKVLKDRLKQFSIRELTGDARLLYYKRLQYLVARINDDLKAISRLISEQNEYIRQNRVSQAARELKMHGEFFRLVYDESLKQKEIQSNIIIILRQLNNIATLVRRETIDERLKRLRFAKVAPNSVDMRRFVRGPYTERFPDPDERESEQVLNESVAEGALHIIVAKVDEVVVGGIVYSMFAYDLLEKGTANKASEKPAASIIFWTCVVQGLRERGIRFVGSRLVEKCKKDLAARASYSGMQLNCILAEINDPEKMSAAELQAEAMEPLKRIDFWQRHGFKKLFKGYVQLTSDPKKFVYYCTLFAFPASGRWGIQRSVSRAELYSILVGLQISNNGYKDEKSLRGYKPWEDMVAALNSQEEYPFRLAA
ncbi:hypothetical protein HYW21_06320 [Candidatus Woesearchaeota archaeon]|nr:hypothetical protein [Candidatus Woesearchaeota archaeon]